MTQTDLKPPAAAASLYEPCEECGAPLDPRQRYCVECAARRGNGANPSSRYFAAMSKKARRPLVAPRAKATPSSRAAAVGFFALLPIAVAIGVVVGRSDGGDGSDNEALLQALRKQDAAVATTAAATPSASAASGKSGKKAKNAKAASRDGGKVIAETDNGTVHAVTGFKPSAEKEEADTQLVEENPEQVGDNYIKAQQNLPDVVVVGSDATGGPAPGSGVEP